MKNKNLKVKNGFTLVELLVAVGLFTALATVIISVLFVSFRASKKSEVIVAVKQSGDAAMSRMANEIRYAKSIDDPLVCVPDVMQDSITITALNGEQIIYGCPGVVIESISSNSAALVDVNSIEVEACSFVCSQSTTNDPPTITIQFALSAANATDFAETSSFIPFQTAVTLRNYIR